jgi:adenylate cyclase
VLKLTYAQKLALTMTSLVLLVATLVGYPLVYRQFSMMEEQFDSLGQVLSQQAATNAVEPIFVEDEFAIERLIRSFEEHERVVSVILINRDLEVFGTSYPRPPMQLLETNAQFLNPGVVNEPNNISWFFTPIIFAGEAGKDIIGGAAWIGLNKAPIIDNQRLVLTSAISALVLLVLTILWLAVRLSRSLSEPINQLIAAAQAMISGNYSYRIRESQSGEFANVKAAFNNMAENLEEKLTLEKNISRFVSPPVAQHYMSKSESELIRQGERVEASIMFVDLVKYTQFSEQNSPEVVADTLNLYFSEISDACHRFQGNVDKFIGDCAMLVFGCPYPDTLHKEHSLECALYIRNRIHELNAQRRLNKEPWMDIRIGLAGGVVLAGLLGSSERLTYSVIGDAANLAARLCDKAPAGEIMTDRGFLQSLSFGDALRTHETQRLDVKGFSNPIDTLVVEDIDRPLSESP